VVRALERLAAAARERNVSFVVFSVKAYPGLDPKYERDEWRDGQRELLEETGYAGPDARVIGTVLPNPAFMDNKTTTIYCPRVTCVAEQQLDPMEELQVVKIPVERVERTLKEGGELATALGMVALMWWQMAR